jgi:hypothetical protein
MPCMMQRIMGVTIGSWQNNNPLVCVRTGWDVNLAKKVWGKLLPPRWIVLNLQGMKIRK